MGRIVGRPAGGGARERTPLHRGVLWLGSATLIGTVGEGIFNLAAVVLLLQRNGSPFELGFLFTLMTLPSIILAPFQGVLIDRWPLKTQAVAGSVARAAIVLALAAVAAGQLLSTSILYSGILVYYIIWYFMIPLSETILARSARAGHLGMVILQGAWQVGALSSAVVAGFLLTVSNTAIVLVLVGLLDLAGAVLLGQLATDAGRAADVPEPTPGGRTIRSYALLFWTDIADTARYVAARPQLCLLVLVGAMVHPIFQVINTLVGPLNQDALGGTPLTLGWIESMAGLGSLVAAVLSGWVTGDRWGRTTLFAAQLLLAAAVAALPLSRSVGEAALLYTGIGIFTGYWKILSKTLLLTAIDVAFAGRIMTAVSFCGLVAGVVAALAAGWLGSFELSLGYTVGVVLALGCAASMATGFVRAAPVADLPGWFGQLLRRTQS
jgi:DHA3 family macrolide efflux protein-like MFS transporter